VVSWQRPHWLGREDLNHGIAVDVLGNARASPTCSQRQQQQQTDAKPAGIPR